MLGSESVATSMRGDKRGSGKSIRRWGACSHTYVSMWNSMFMNRVETVVK